MKNLGFKNLLIGVLINSVFFIFGWLIISQPFFSYEGELSLLIALDNIVHLLIVLFKFALFNVFCFSYWSFMNYVFRKKNSM